MGEPTLMLIIKCFFKRLFCKHNFLKDYFIDQDPEWLYCDKCGKLKHIKLKG